MVERTLSVPWITGPGWGGSPEDLELAWAAEMSRGYGGIHSARTDEQCIIGKLELLAMRFLESTGRSLFHSSGTLHCRPCACAQRSVKRLDQRLTSMYCVPGRLSS